MANPTDFVFTQIYKQSMAQGVNERLAHRVALVGLDDYKKGRYQGKPSKLIDDRVAEAKKSQKAGGKF